MARKPFIGTVALNVSRHDCGAINIDACRISGEPWKSHKATGFSSVKFFTEGIAATIVKEPNDLGRWPANLIHDGSDEVLAAFPDAPGQLAAVKYDGDSRKTAGIHGAMKRGHEPSAGQRYTQSGVTNFAATPGARRLDSGSAARFFFCAKASKHDRGPNNTWPTVKPTTLMRYLCRLVTPAHGTVLDPMAGSGTTGVAALLEGFDFIGIEKEPDGFEIAKSRLQAVLAEIRPQPVQSDQVAASTTPTQPVDSPSPNPQSPVP